MGLKQVAQQEAEKARFLVEKAEQVKKASSLPRETPRPLLCWQQPSPRPERVWLNCGGSRRRRRWLPTCPARGTWSTCPPTSRPFSPCHSKLARDAPPFKLMPRREQKEKKISTVPPNSYQTFNNSTVSTCYARGNTEIRFNSPPGPFRLTGMAVYLINIKETKLIAEKITAR